MRVRGQESASRQRDAVVECSAGHPKSPGCAAQQSQPWVSTITENEPATVEQPPGLATRQAGEGGEKQHRPGVLKNLLQKK